MVRAVDLDAALPYGVEYFTDFKEGHDLGGKCEYRHGWWSNTEDLKLRHRIKGLEECLRCKDKYGIDEDDEDDDA
jgi:hypothetical protein